MNISMADVIYDFPEQLSVALGLCKDFTVPKFKPEKMIIFGMGGSAIGADLLSVVAEKEASFPVFVVRNNEVPGYVDSRTLAIAVSYSGNTQETLSAFKTLVNQKKASLITVCTGGKLEEMAVSQGMPCLKIPGGLMPRAALAFTFVPLLYILQQSCGRDLDISLTVQVLRKMREQLASHSSQNPARTVASLLDNKIPVIYAPTPSFAPAARRWKCQMNENAKQPAYWDTFSEATHNDIVGFTHPLAAHSSLASVFLRDVGESAIVRRRIELTKQTIEATGTVVVDVPNEGEDFLSRLFSFCYYGDFVSLYLAEQNKVDPISIHVIDRLKEEMAAVK